MKPPLAIFSSRKMCGKLFRCFLLLPSAIFVIGVLGASTAFGQADYSAVWVDDSNPDAAFVVGAGVTDNDYTGDAIEVQTTITSPAGRTMTGYGDGVGFAFAEVALPWDWNDIGQYLVRTRHQPYCMGEWDGSNLIHEVHHGNTIYMIINSNYFRCLESRTTVDAFRTGISVAVYQNTSCFVDECGTGGCNYSITENCDTTCKQQRVQTTYRACRLYLIRTTPFQEVLGHTTCLRITARDDDSSNPALCYDLDTR